MKQLQFYKYAIGGLLVLNLSMIAFFVLTAPPPKGPRESGKKAIDILKMDEEQNDFFLQSAQQHVRQMDDFAKQQRILLKLYFSSLIDSENPINSDSLLHQVQLLERKKIESTYQHFEDMKVMLKPEQQVHFEGFIEHALEFILLDKKKQLPPTRK